MNAIMGENELLQRFEEYKDKGAEIISLYHPEDCTVEFGRGGREMDRGYYCPSPILDFLVGGLNRGRLLKRQPSPETYDWVYCRDKTGALDRAASDGSRTIIELQRDGTYGRTKIIEGHNVSVFRWKDSVLCISFCQLQFPVFSFRTV